MSVEKFKEIASEEFYFPVFTDKGFDFLEVNINTFTLTAEIGLRYIYVTLECYRPAICIYIQYMGCHCRKI